MSPAVLVRARRALLATVAPALLLAGGCRAEDPTGPGDELKELPRALTEAERQTIAAGNEFSVALFREVNARKAGENVFISPFSAAMALGMTLNGAAGTTAEEMRGTLGVAGRTPQEINESYRSLTELLLSLDGSVSMGIANAIFHERTFPFEPSFMEVSREYFDAEVEGLDFSNEPATLQAVNAWAKEQTNGRIEKVLDDMGDEVMFLMNALYFKGSWRTQFDPRRTQPQPFTRHDGTQASVPMMSHDRMKLALRTTPEGVQVGELPYGNGAFAMTIVLPPRGESVDAFVASLTPARWAALTDGLTQAQLETMVRLPRFRLTYDDTWNDVLTAMGMGSAFDETRADFSNMSRERRLLLSFVKQSAFVDVNEEGTEAAAVTTVGAMPTSAPPSLVVDRPFVFAIRERLSGTLLFVGKVARL